MAWDPETYLNFGDERTRPASDLLARVPLRSPGHVVDLGCGPGNSTALLVRRWPRAYILGIDSSAEMIARAIAGGVRARFSIAAFETWPPDVAPDLIYSNAALHWAADPVALARRLHDGLAPQGVLAFQIPQNFDAPSHTIPHALAADFGIAAARWYDPAAFPQGRDFARALGDADIWTTTYLHRLAGPDPVYDWVAGSALRPFLDRLAEGPCAAFIAEAKQRYAAAYPPEPDGTTLFPFRRLFVVARRG